jgi:hypothetical protein
VTSQISHSCGEDSKEVAGWPIDRIEQTITPTADQRALLDDFANASIRAAQTIKEACPTTFAFAPTGRLDAMEPVIGDLRNGLLNNEGRGHKGPTLSATINRVGG